METQGNTSTGSRHHDFDINLVTFDLTFLEVLELPTREWRTWLFGGRGVGGGGGELEERKRCGWGRVAIKSSIYMIFLFFLLDARNLVMSV